MRNMSNPNGIASSNGLTSVFEHSQLILHPFYKSKRGEETEP
jgi:hypothetical protein